jgi:ribosome-binding factor A
MPHRTRRTERVDELLKQEIARIIRELKDPRIGFATVMDVRTSPDLRHARVYVSVLGEESEKQDTIAALGRARGFVRVRVGEEVSLKYRQSSISSSTARWSAARIEASSRICRLSRGRRPGDREDE